MNTLRDFIIMPFAFIDLALAALTLGVFFSATAELVTAKLASIKEN
jgi:hypothetical protein